MKNSLETRLGLFFALAMIVGFLLIEMVGSFDFLTPGTRLRSRFPTVQDLTEGDPVKMGGKIIGRVQSITLTNQQVEVSMKITNPDLVRTDSQATIRFAGLMGQNYVDLSFGSAAAPPATPNTILESYAQPDIGVIMSRLENVAGGIENITKSFTGVNIQEIIGPLTDFLRDNSPRLTAILANFQTLSTRLTEGQGSIGKLLNDDALYASAMSTITNFDAAGADVRVALQDARKLLEDVRGGEGSIGLMLKDETLYREATASLASMHEILEKINRGQGTMGKVVNDESLYRNLRLSLQKVDKATESLEDQGPLSAISIIVGGLF